MQLAKAWPGDAARCRFFAEREVPNHSASVVRSERAVLQSGDATEPHSEKDAKLAQKLGQLRHAHRKGWANSHLLGQPNTFLAHLAVRERGAARDRVQRRQHLRGGTALNTLHNTLY